MLTVTQQTPTSRQGETETQMSKMVTACLMFTMVHMFGCTFMAVCCLFAEQPPRPLTNPTPYLSPPAHSGNTVAL